MKMLGFGAFIFITIIANHFGVEGQAQAWSYSGPTGPSNWGKLPGASACLGRRQSPININTFETGQKAFPPLVMQGYDAAVSRGPTQPTSMVNTGATLQVNLQGNYILSGGGLPNKYKAAQLHLHWGADNTKGSEHRENGESWPAELHIVHYNMDLYQNLGQAISKPNGIAFLGFWIQLGRHNRAWDAIIGNLEAVKYANNPFIFTTPFAIRSLLPNDLSRFYRYKGSLTTPGCYETVTWTMMDNKITISRAQIAKLRQLSKFSTPPYGPGAGPELHRRLVDNYRPIQRMWFRTVYQSWPHDSFAYYDMNGNHGNTGGSPAGGNPAAGNPAAGNPALPGYPTGGNPKFRGIFTGYGPDAGSPGAGGTGAGAGAGASAGGAGGAPAGGPAGMYFGPNLEGDTGVKTGMQRLWHALRNNEYEAQEADFYYAGFEYGNMNDDDYDSKYSFAKWK